MRRTTVFIFLILLLTRPAKADGYVMSGPECEGVVISGTKVITVTAQGRIYSGETGYVLLWSDFGIEVGESLEFTMEIDDQILEFNEIRPECSTPEPYPPPDPYPSQDLDPLDVGFGGMGPSEGRDPLPLILTSLLLFFTAVVLVVLAYQERDRC